MILPLAKKTQGVYTIETAKALATFGGQPRQLFDALWQGARNEYTVDKVDRGYLVVVLQQAGEGEVQAWTHDISSINTRARTNSLEKLDATYIALTRAAETGARAQADAAAQDGASTNPRHAVHQALSQFIDDYFAATSDPSAVVAGDAQERRRRLYSALGEQYREPAAAPPGGVVGGPAGRSGVATGNAAGKVAAASTTESEERQGLEYDAVYSVTARLVMSPEWPKIPSDEPAAIAHVVAQVLAGIGTEVMPASKWRTHRCWGRFRFGDFDHLEELVATALVRLRATRLANAGGAPAAPKPAGQPAGS